MRKIDGDETGGLISFRAPPGLIADIDAIAASEGISRSDVARRAEFARCAPNVPLTLSSPPPHFPNSQRAKN